MGDLCKKCGKPLPEGAKACEFCKAQVTRWPKSAPLRRRVNMSFIQYVISVIKDFIGLIKKPKALFKFVLPTLILSLVWLVLSLISSFGFGNSGIVKALCFLTYANGGMVGSAIGRAGGIIGKALFGYVLCVIINALINKHKISFGELIKGFSITGARSVGLLLGGAGLALFCYLFLNSTASFQNSMVAAACIAYITMAQNAGRGLLIYLISGLASLLTLGKGISVFNIRTLLSGMILGFAVSMPLSYFNSKLLIQVVCCIAAIIGFSLCAFGHKIKLKKEPAAGVANAISNN